jgi:hypothetical protein
MWGSRCCLPPAALPMAAAAAVGLALLTVLAAQRRRFAAVWQPYGPPAVGRPRRPRGEPGWRGGEDEDGAEDEDEHEDEDEEGGDSEGGGEGGWAVRPEVRAEKTCLAHGGGAWRRERPPGSHAASVPLPPADVAWSVLPPAALAGGLGPLAFMGLVAPPPQRQSPMPAEDSAHANPLPSSHTESDIPSAEGKAAAPPGLKGLGQAPAAALAHAFAHKGVCGGQALTWTLALPPGRATSGRLATAATPMQPPPPPPPLVAVANAAAAATALVFADLTLTVPRHAGCAARGGARARRRRARRGADLHAAGGVEAQTGGLPPAVWPSTGGAGAAGAVVGAQPLEPPEPSEPWGRGRRAVLDRVSGARRRGAASRKMNELCTVWGWGWGWG